LAVGFADLVDFTSFSYMLTVEELAAAVTESIALDPSASRLIPCCRPCVPASQWASSPFRRRLLGPVLNLAEDLDTESFVIGAHQHLSLGGFRCPRASGSHPAPTSELTIALPDGPRRLHSIDQQGRPAVSAGQVSVQV